MYTGRTNGQEWDVAQRYNNDRDIEGVGQCRVAGYVGPQSLLTVCWPSAVSGAKGN